MFVKYVHLNRFSEFSHKIAVKCKSRSSEDITKALIKRNIIQIPEVNYHMNRANIVPVL